MKRTIHVLASLPVYTAAVATLTLVVVLVLAAMGLLF